MQLIHYLTIWFVGMPLARTQLHFTDPTRDDGVCQYPGPLPVFSSNFQIYNPFKTFYIPVASENFFRFEYQMATNEPAKTEDDVTSLQTKVQFVQFIDFVTTVSDVRVYFFNDTSVYYTYRGIPNLSANPPYDLRATAIHGGKTSGPTGLGGEIVFTIIWNDDSPAFNVYTCVGGRQMFHIIAGAKTLTDSQLEINKNILVGMGFNADNFHFLKYSD